MVFYHLVNLTHLKKCTHDGVHHKRINIDKMKKKNIKIIKQVNIV